MTWNVAKLKEWYSELPAGTTARRNHDECPSGVDRRRRLYVTKSEDNQTLRCYCHNCGSGTNINLRHAPRLRAVAIPKTNEPVKLPPQWRASGPAIHPRHKMWLKAYGILGEAELRQVYSMSEYELVFPYGPACERDGYQIRYFDGRTPKWRNTGSPIGWSRGPRMIVCEDIVSALKWTAATCGGYVSLGGHRPSLPPDVVTGLVGTTIVWLDNDKPTVVQASEDLAISIATGHGKPTVLIRGGTDPKRYSKDELEKVARICDELVKSSPADGRPYHVLEILPPNQGVCTGA